MEKLTLRQSTIVGTVQGKRVMATVRASQPGLLLPAGQYVLHPPVDNPVYGRVMPIEPVRTPGAPSAHKLQPQTQTRAAAVKVDSPAIKFDSPAIKFDSPAIKFDSPAIKFDSAAGGAQPIVLTSRPIAGNTFLVTAGLGELFEAVRRAGGVILVVE